MQNLKFVIPKLEETFGELTFGGVGEPVSRRVNGITKTVGRTYNLFSSRQRADNIEVMLPRTVGEKHFGYDEPVKLVNPCIMVEGYTIDGRGYTSYKMTAEDMIAAREA